MENNTANLATESKLNNASPIASENTNTQSVQVDEKFNKYLKMS